jgi:beta-phosphoglucomutase-like phosphatase (HAD superfamily)
VLEDSPAGVEAARVAGMPVVAVDRGRGPIRLEHATWTVATLDHLALAPTGHVTVTTRLDEAGT